MPLVAFPWESASISSVRFSAAANEAAKFIAVVVLPTPPFWLVTLIIFLMFQKDCVRAFTKDVNTKLVLFVIFLKNRSVKSDYK